jgi:hypothetical protein
MTHFVCFLWGDWGKPYSVKYVNNLCLMLLLHYKGDFDLTCITDRKPTDFHVLVKTQDIQYYDPTKYGSRNFPKFIIFNPEFRLEGEKPERVVVIDLDSYIIDDSFKNIIDSYQGDFCGIKPFRPENDHVGGGLLSVNLKSDTAKKIWNAFVENKDEYDTLFDGKERLVFKKLIDDGVIPRGDRWQELFPGKLVSYKRHVRKLRGKFPAGSCFVAFHGNPRPHQADIPRIRKLFHSLDFKNIEKVDFGDIDE